MRSPAGKPTSKANPQTLEWHVCEDEGEWRDTQDPFAAPLPVEMERQRWTRSKLRRWGASAVCILLSLMLLGGWLWQRAQVGLDEVENQVETEIAVELWSGRQLHTPAEAVGANLLNSMELPSDPGEIVTHVEIRDLGSDWAVVEVLMQPTQDGPIYHQTRLYHDTRGGWVRGKVVVTHWGRSRRVESSYFIFQYRALDEEAVLQVAPQLDLLYPELLNSLHRELPLGEKLMVTIDPEFVFAKPDYTSPPRADLVVASPSATLAPAELPASDLLLQALVIGMYNRLTVDAPTNSKLPINWARIHKSLRLWFIWEHELPLAVWRKALVEWVLKAPEEAARQTRSDVPAFAGELCLHHSLWMRTPVDIGVPILCWDRDAGGGKVDVWPSQQTVAELSPGALIYLSTTYMDNRFSGANPRWQAPYTVILATVFEYIASSYGSERIPLLLAEIPEHEGAGTLIPAVFGVSLDEFTEGWRAFVIKRYEISR